MRTRCIAAAGLLIGTLAAGPGRADEPVAKAATEQKLAEHPLEQPIAKAWRTHRDAGHLPLLDPAHWQLLGCQTFSPQDIRTEIARDDDVRLATHPAAPADDLEKLPALLAEKVLDGYRTAGFPQATVQARREGEQIKIEIVEGPRLIAGPIEITGAKTLDVKQLLARLVEPYIPEYAKPAAFEENSDGKTRIVWLDSGGSFQRLKDPAWQLGKPARLAPADYMRWHVEKACANQGRPDAKFNLEIKTEPGSNTARLLVRITDEGPPLLIKLVSVAGCKQNTPQQVIDYLQVKPGTAWTRERELLAKQRLWQAGRFREFELKIERPVGSGEATLTVNVTESEVAPALSQPFTPMEQAFLKFRDFIGAFSTSDDDLICTWTDGHHRHEVVVSPKLGSIFSFGPENTGAEPAQASSAAISTDALALYSQATGRRLVARPLPGNLLMTLEFGLEIRDGEEGGKLLAGVGANTWASAPPGSPALRTLILAPPVAFINMARRYAETSTLADGILTIGMPDEDDEDGHPSTRLRVLAATGRLLEADCGKDHVRVTIAKNAYRDRARALEAEFGEMPNEFDPHRPLGSTLAFVAREMDTSQLLPDLDEVSSTALKVARKSLALNLLEPLDESLVRLNAATHGPHTEFWLGSYPKRPRDWRGKHAETAYCVWLFSDDWAARGTWLGDLTREALIASVGMDEYTQMEIAQHLAGTSDGPLANLAAAIVLNQTGRTAEAQRFARRGLERLDAAKFRADVTALLDNRGLLGRLLLRAGEVARQLGEDDLAVLAARQNIYVQLLVQTFARELADAPQQPIAEALPDVLDRLWDSHLKQYVAAGLQACAGAPPKAKTPSATPSASHLQPPTSTKPPQP